MIGPTLSMILIVIDCKFCRFYLPQWYRKLNSLFANSRRQSDIESRLDLVISLTRKDLNYDILDLKPRKIIL